MILIDTNTKSYPLTYSRIIALYPSVSFPSVPSDTDLATVGVARVEYTARPPFDASRQYLKEDVPVKVNGVYQQVWRVTMLPEVEAATKLAELKQSIIIKIDKDVDTIYDAAIGSRGMEYALASEQAYAFKAINYQGEVPSSVASWAAAKNWNAKQAADDIILAAERWGRARDALREKRLAHKEEARAATFIDALSLVESSWNTFVVSIRNRLGI